MVHVTAAAKMVSHAHFGIPREVMGLLQGNHTFIKDPSIKTWAKEYLWSPMLSTSQSSPRKHESLLTIKPTPSWQVLHIAFSLL